MLDFPHDWKQHKKSITPKHRCFISGMKGKLDPYSQFIRAKVDMRFVPSEKTGLKLYGPGRSISFLLKAESGINGELLALELFHTAKTDYRIWLLIPITLYSRPRFGVPPEAKYFPYLDKDFSLSTYGKTEIRLTWAKFWLVIRSWRYDR